MSEDETPSASESESHLKRAVDNLPGIAYRCRPEPHRDMKVLGGRVQATTGYSASAFESGVIEYGDIVVSEDVEELERKLRTAVDDQSEFSVTYRIRTQDGKIRHVLERGSPVVEGGDVVALEGIILDITDRKRSERRLRRQNNLFTNTQRLADVGGWELDVKDWELQWTDQVKVIHGLQDDASPSLDDAIGFYHPEDRSEISDAVERALEDGEPFDLALRIQTEDGEQRWVRAKGTPTVRNGEVVRLSGAVQDITELKKREQLLRLLHRLLRHNLRNDLSVIMGYADTLDEELVEETPSEYVEAIETAATDLLRKSETAKDLLNLSLEPTDTKGPVDLGELLEATREELQERHPKAEIEVSIDESPVVEGEARLGALFTQLLENAIEHSERDIPRVEVTVYTTENEARIEIADNGPGIPPEEWTVTVEEGETNSTQLRHGSGVGLLLATWIAEDYGGHLEYEYEGEDGALVTVVLPHQ